ncbi:hypothetical protein [Cohnella massiliensis]|nr:hypothetical protein [Cohnella massiliensis]
MKRSSVLIGIAIGAISVLVVLAVFKVRLPIPARNGTTSSATVIAATRPL